MGIQLRKILCATDFSEYAENLLNYGAGLSRQLGARLVVFHTVFFPSDQLYVSSAIEKSEARRRRMANAHEKINTIMQDHDVEWEPYVSYGETVDEILRATSELNIELVVAAIHRITGLQRFFLGTLVEQLARKLNRPFLVINPKRDAKNNRPSISLQIKRIIVGCNASQPSLPVLRQVGFWASHFDSDVHVLHAIQSPIEPARKEDEPIGPYAKVQEDIQHRLQQKLEHLLRQEVRIPQKVQAVVKAGIPKEVLLEYAIEQTADLMIIGVRQQGSFEKMVIGSTTEAALRNSPCPVLVIPSKRIGRSRYVR
jgi:nucleotide-binding universal stress UspA family protein